MARPFIPQSQSQIYQMLLSVCCRYRRQPCRNTHKTGSHTHSHPTRSPFQSRCEAGCGNHRKLRSPRVHSWRKTKWMNSFIFFLIFLFFFCFRCFLVPLLFFIHSQRCVCLCRNPRKQCYVSASDARSFGHHNQVVKFPWEPMNRKPNPEKRLFAVYFYSALIAIKTFFLLLRAPSPLPKHHNWPVSQPTCQTETGEETTIFFFPFGSFVCGHPFPFWCNIKNHWNKKINSFGHHHILKQGKTIHGLGLGLLPRGQIVRRVSLCMVYYRKAIPK